MATARKTAQEERPADAAGKIKTKFEAYEGNEPYVFVSYSHRDEETVYPILDLLYDRRFRIWYDESCETGNDFRQELRSKIEGAEAILLFVSANSMGSRFCGMEVIVARENNKRIFPVFLEEGVVPPAFDMLLENTHHGSVDDIPKLIKALVRDLPPSAMDRLTTEGQVLLKCEDNGTSIAVDEGITTICEGAFKDRVQLHHIKLPSTLEIIERESFRGCSRLESIVIPEGTMRIGESAFRDCVSMKSLRVDNEKAKIGDRAFENCVSLESIDLPEGMTEIYAGVFNSCRSLKRIDLPANLTILGENAFADCSALESIKLPDSVAKIDDLVFTGCKSLGLVVLNNGLKKIGKAAFKNCESLTEITIPVSVSSFIGAPFRGCSRLRSIRVEPKNKYYKSEPTKRDGDDHVLFNKNKSVLIAYPAASREVQYDVPDSVMSISDWAFSECRKLNRITIPDSVREIGEGAFSDCALLDEIEIPDSVTKIDDCAFRGCEKLERVIIPASVVDLGWGLFDGCEGQVTVYCDEGSVAQQYCLRNGIREERIDGVELG